MYIIFRLIGSINAETIPRFDMRDKDGIIFDPIAPRAGEKLTATCTLVGMASDDKRHVNILIYLIEKISLLRLLNIIEKLFQSE